MLLLIDYVPKIKMDLTGGKIRDLEKVVWWNGFMRKWDDLSKSEQTRWNFTFGYNEPVKSD